MLGPLPSLATDEGEGGQGVASAARSGPAREGREGGKVRVEDRRVGGKGGRESGKGFRVLSFDQAHVGSVY